MFLLADLLQYQGEANRTVRILWLGPAGHAFTIDVNQPKALPKLAELSSLADDVKNERARLLKDDPFLVIAADSDLSEARIERRERAWKAIEPLLSHQPDIFWPKHRARLVSEREAAGFGTRVVIYDYLRLYWQRGMTKNALLADFPNCGGPGKTRNSSEGEKRGRPKVHGDQPGVNITPDLRRTFQISVDRFYASSEKFSKKGAYDQMVKEFFCDKRLDTETGLVIHTPFEGYAATGLPTYDQFLYWVDKDNCAPVLRRKRMGAARYDKDLRGLTGTATAETWGPGSRFQIDATIADVFLVSRLDRRRIIGRPVLYVVIDVFSRMIVGIYVGLEGPSWIGAMMALANTAEDKVKFCKRFGRVITHDEWPCDQLPATLLGDGGEIASELISVLLTNFNIVVETAASYRADWKGIIERRFRLLPAVYKPFVPGYIDVDYRARGGTDYRYDAALDIDDFTGIIIESALYFNNEYELSKYDKDRSVAADRVPPIPTDLWDWGKTHRSGALRSFPHDLVKFFLMPVANASVTELGLKFKGNYYTTAKAVEDRWFDRARQQGRWQVPVSYDTRDIDRICVHDPKSASRYSIATLTDRSRANKHLTLFEAEQQDYLAKHDSANRRLDQQMAKADFIGNVEGIVAKAKAKTASAADGNTPDVKNIRTNRAAEKTSNRDSEAFRPGETATRKFSAEIVQFPTKTPVIAEDYSEPGIAELLGEEEPPL
jgi:hypothetical protein